jgi:Cytochrome C biogenesis protein transmembrane region
MDSVHIGHLSSALVAFCGVADTYGAFGIAVALFGAGLVGSFAHCAPMCGPFVMMQLTEPDGGDFALRKLAAGALPGYQLGRMTTYAALGLLVGGLGGSLVALTQFHWCIRPVGWHISIRSRRPRCPLPSPNSSCSTPSASSMRTVMGSAILPGLPALLRRAHARADRRARS